MCRRKRAGPGVAVRARFAVMASRRFTGKPDNNTMKILFESLLVCVPVITTIMLLSCLFMASMADRIMPGFADGKDGYPIKDEEFDTCYQGQ
jgi:hypothetical protein